MGQSTGVLFKEVSAFWRCPLIEASLHYVLTNACFSDIECPHVSYVHVYVYAHMPLVLDL